MHGLTEACLRGDGSTQLLTPNFTYSVPVAKLAKQLTNAMHSIRDDHVEEAKAILDAALESVGGAAEVFERKVYGEEVDQTTAKNTSWTSSRLINCRTSSGCGSRRTACPASALCSGLAGTPRTILK